MFVGLSNFNYNNSFRNIWLTCYVADGVGFEPTRGVNPCRFSRPVLSTAQPPIPARINNNLDRGARTIYEHCHPAATQGLSRLSETCQGGVDRIRRLAVVLAEQVRVDLQGDVRRGVPLPSFRPVVGEGQAARATPGERGDRGHDPHRSRLRQGQLSIARDLGVGVSTVRGR
jgi:hypothetical protein